MALREFVFQAERLRDVSATSYESMRKANPGQTPAFKLCDAHVKPLVLQLDRISKVTNKIVDYSGFSTVPISDAVTTNLVTILELLNSINRETPAFASYCVNKPLPATGKVATFDEAVEAVLAISQISDMVLDYLPLLQNY